MRAFSLGFGLLFLACLFPNAAALTFRVLNKRVQNFAKQEKAEEVTALESGPWTTLLSESCSGTTGTFNAGATALGGVCIFNGNNQYVSVGSIPVTTGPMTFLAWASWSTFNSWSRVFDCKGVVMSNANSNPDLYFQSAFYGQISGVLTANQWFLVVGTFNPQTSTGSMYYNSGSNGQSFSGALQYPLGPCNLGWSTWDVDQGFNGYIDQFNVVSGIFQPSDVNNVWTIPVTGLSYSPSTLQMTSGSAVSIVPTLTYGGQFGGGVSFTTSPALPAGLTLNPLTGVISGTPSGVSLPSTKFTITAKNAGGSVSSTVTLSLTGGSVLLSESCSGTTGTFNAGATSVAGLCVFNGNKQYVSVGSISVTTGPMTFLAWASWSTFNSWSRVFDCKGVIMSNANSNPDLYFQSAFYGQISGVLTANQWFLVVGTFNPQTSTGSMYYNSGSNGQSFSGALQYPLATCNLGWSTWDVDQGFNGYIDQFNVLSGIFQPSDVNNVYTIAVNSLSYTPSSLQVPLSAAVSMVPKLGFAGSFGGGCTFSVSPALPAGISLNPLTGVISGSSTLNTGPTTFTITASNAGGKVTTAVSLQVGIAGAVSFSWDGTAAGAGALTQLVVYTTAAGGVVGLQATFGGYVSTVAGETSATSVTVTIQPGEYLAQVTSWFSGVMITGFRFTTSLGKTWGPYGLSAGNGDVQAVASQAVVKIAGSSLATGLIYPLTFSWSAGPTGTVPFGTVSGGAFNVASPRQSNANCAPSYSFVPVQTVTFFLYNGKGTAVPNYICGVEISSGGVPSLIVGTFTWPDTTGTITTQTVVIPPNDSLNRWDINTCNIAPGANQMCGVTITSTKGVVWNVGTTAAQASAAGASPYLVQLNYAQNAPSCAFRGFWGNYQTLTQNGVSISYLPDTTFSLVE